jgi:hypothetical protein
LLDGVVRGTPLWQAAIDVLLMGVPGAGLVDGGYQLSHSDLRRGVYPRVAAWCVVGALALGPS